MLHELLPILFRWFPLPCHMHLSTTTQVRTSAKMHWKDTGLPLASRTCYKPFKGTTLPHPALNKTLSLQPSRVAEFWFHVLQQCYIWLMYHMYHNTLVVILLVSRYSEHHLVSKPQVGLHHCPPTSLSLSFSRGLKMVMIVKKEE